MKNQDQKPEKVKRSKLWNGIYDIVKNIPREKSVGDAMDYSSASTEVEELVKRSIGLN